MEQQSPAQQHTQDTSPAQGGQLLATTRLAVPSIPQQLHHTTLTTSAWSPRSWVNRGDPSSRAAEHSEAVKWDLKAFGNYRHWNELGHEINSKCTE